MELYEVMRSTFAAREFTDAPLSDDTLCTILDNARFAPSGGNRQGKVTWVENGAFGSVCFSRCSGLSVLFASLQGATFLQ